MSTVNIFGIPKEYVLKALHDATQPVGRGTLHAVFGDMPIEQARRMVREGGHDDLDLPLHGGHLDFDYVLGRPVKTDISGGTFDPQYYDQDAPGGAGSAAEAIATLWADRPWTL